MFIVLLSLISIGWLDLVIVVSSMIVGLGMCIVLLSSYFNISATRSFFQEFNENTDNIISCKTCDMVHDFSQYLSEQLVISSFDEKVCHSMLTLSFISGHCL